MKDMYKNQARYKSCMVTGILEVVLGFALSGFFLLGFIALLTTDMIGGVVFFAMMFVASVVAVVFGIRRLVLLGAVSYCSKLFAQDNDGYVSMDAVLERRGARKGSAFERRVQRAADKGFFLKVTYDKANRVFELSDRVSNTEEYSKRFVGLNCPNCGAPLKVRKGTVARCDRCGGEVRA
ncbi:MAG: hypothetical protein IJ757_03495 [Clostridiales bacterium]|nr:hypothetical protein [Clostridiales bacterium]